MHAWVESGLQVDNSWAQSVVHLYVLIFRHIHVYSAKGVKAAKPALSEPVNPINGKNPVALDGTMQWNICYTSFLIFIFVSTCINASSPQLTWFRTGNLTPKMGWIRIAGWWQLSAIHSTPYSYSDIHIYSAYSPKGVKAAKPAHYEPINVPNKWQEPCSSCRYNVTHPAACTSLEFWSWRHWYSGLRDANIV